MNYNRVILVGRLTHDPELRATADGISVVRFSIAVNRPTRPGEEQQVDYFDIVAFRQLAETVANYMTKGRLVLVEGRLQTRRYTDRDGVPRRSFEILADTVRFLERRDMEPTPAESADTAVAPRAAQRPAAAPTPAAPEPADEYEPDYYDIDYDLEATDDLPEDPFK